MKKINMKQIRWVEIECGTCKSKLTLSIDDYKAYHTVLVECQVCHANFGIDNASDANPIALLNRLVSKVSAGTNTTFSFLFDEQDREEQK